MMSRSRPLALAAAAIALGVVAWLATVRSPEDRAGDAPIGASPIAGRPAPGGAATGLAAGRTAGATTGSAAGRTGAGGNDGAPRRAARDAPASGDGRSARGAAAEASGAAPRGRFARRARAILDRHLSSAGLDARVGEAEREALVDALVAVRASSRQAQRREGDEPAQAAARARLVVETDRRFREALGIGVARFLADAGPPNRVVDLAPATQ